MRNGVELNRIELNGKERNGMEWNGEQMFICILLPLFFCFDSLFVFLEMIFYRSLNTCL